MTTKQRKFVYMPGAKKFNDRKCKTRALYVKKEHATKAAEFFTRKLGIRFKVYKCQDHYHLQKIKGEKK